MILLDTHALVWQASGSSRLGARSRRLCEQALRARELATSAISFWEVALLVRSGRVALGMRVDRWRAAFLGLGPVEVPLTGEIAIRASDLEGLTDHADRMIVATALVHNATLLTADEPILDWNGPLRTVDAGR